MSLSGEALARSLPVIDWAAAAERLDDELRPWLEADHPSKPVIFFVAPPFAGREEILAAWGTRSGFPVVHPPCPEEVRRGTSDWIGSWPTGEPWVLPHLEKCFIREAAGLDVARDLLARLLSGELGRGVVGCDSWAWQFLRHVWPARPSYTMTLQAFSASIMFQLFARSIGRSEDRQSQFRTSTDGRMLLPDDSVAGERDSVAPYWKQLAAYCRGNLGVAAAVWSRSLRRLPEKDIDNEEDSKPDVQWRNTVWVTPVHSLDMPAIPGEVGETALFALHALLLHNGLSADALARLLPVERAIAVEVLLFLREASLVDQIDEQWRVSPFGYPVVRDTLKANDFLCDPF